MWRNQDGDAMFTFLLAVSFLCLDTASEELRLLVSSFCSARYMELSRWDPLIRLNPVYMYVYKESGTPYLLTSFNDRPTLGSMLFRASSGSPTRMCARSYPGTDVEVRVSWRRHAFSIKDTMPG
ncbi:hypothetical protein F5B17DRAFT_10983 [Nemania serpens]|nr:hypothetical protein F5B17DRAFT_10983 [Nemania serpens]